MAKNRTPNSPKPPVTTISLGTIQFVTPSDGAPSKLILSASHPSGKVKVKGEKSPNGDFQDSVDLDYLDVELGAEQKRVFFVKKLVIQDIDGNKGSGKLTITIKTV